MKMNTRRLFLKAGVAGVATLGATTLSTAALATTHSGSGRKKCKIAKAEAFAIPIPLNHPFKMAKGTITHSDTVYVRLEDEAGRVGWGETFNVPQIYGRDHKTIHNDLSYLLPALIGLDPLEIAAAHTAMDRALPRSRDGKNGADMALYDLAGKQLGVPVSTLLGGAQVDEVPIIAALSIIPPNEAVAHAKEYVAKGHKYLKLKMGLNWKEDAERAIAVRKAVGPDIVIKADANTVFDKDEALRFLDAVKDVGMQHMEQPIDQYDIKGHAFLAAQSSTPICADESLQTLQDAFNILRADAATAMVLKLLKNGGMYRTKQIVDFCQNVGVPCFLSSGTDMSLSVAANLHCYAAVPGFEGALEVVNVLKDDVAKNPITWGATMKVPTGPGLGIEIDENKIEKYRVKL
jgi:muconate cycloisomerase